MKMKKKREEVRGEGGGVRVVRLGGGQLGCEWRSEAFVKIQKNIFFFFFFWGGGRIWVGGQGLCEQRSEAFVKIQKKIYIFFFWGGGGGGSGWGDRVDVNGEVL